jgi:hypothetical protein
METLEELVAARKGYKYLNADGTSPYQKYEYDLKSRRQMETSLNECPEQSCGEGWNLATLDWISRECLKLDGVIVECEIPKKAKIVVPKQSDGKFRTNIIKIKKEHKIETLFPALKDIKESLRNYQPINPITAEEMPPKKMIKKVCAQVWDQVWAQVMDQVGAQVGDQVGDQVRDQVWDQVRVFAYYAIKLFLDLPYEHPAFDLVRLGIIVVTVDGKVKVFGKDGKFLGEFDE